MKFLGATAQTINRGGTLESHGAGVRKPYNHPSAGATSAGQAVFQRNAHCACGGGCPPCQEGARDFSDVSSRERSADARAAALLRAADPLPEAMRPSLNLAPGPDVPPPPGPAAVVASSGRPLDAGLGRLTTRLGADAGRIRIHDDDDAARAASALGARAFAFGRHLVFGEGRYRPGTSAGDELIAHEVAHIEQQASAGRAALDLSPNDPPLPGTYKPLLDRIAEDEARKATTYGIGGWHLPVLYKMKELAQAAEGKDVERTTAAVTDFLRAARKDPLDPASAVLLGDVPLTLVSRIYLMGLAPESKQLQDYFFDKAGKSYYEQPSYRGGFATDFAVWKRIADDAIAGSTVGDPAQAEASIDLLLIAFKGVNDAAGALDPKQVEKDIEEARKEAMYSFGLQYDADRNVGSHFSHLLTLIPPLVVGIERAFQVLLDAAVADLETGKGNAALVKATSALETKLFPAFNFPRLLSLTLPITRSDFERKKKRHLDYFDERKKAPSAEIQAYSKDETSFFEKDLTIRRIYEIRANQIAVIQRLFGLAKDKFGAATGESAENAAAIKSVAGFKLHDDDSWRAFLLAKFRASRKRLGDDWQALSATIDVLREYLSAFTIHTPYNIDEFGDNYLGRTFPRALTGQFIEDCGVYALKIAYALSLVRKELGLIFRAVVLPVHVALVISFEDMAKGAFFVNNNQFTPVEPSDLKHFAEKWQQRDVKGTTLTTRKALDTNKFLGELAAATFVERTDIPFRVAEFPDVPDVKDPAKRHAVLWNFYHRKVLDQVTAGTKDVAQPELKFLALLEHEKQAYNDLAFPFWRAAHGRFLKQRDALTAAATDLASSDPKKKAAAEATLAAHKKELLELSKPVRDRITQLDAERQKVSTFMAEHPEAVAKTAQLSPWLRLSITFSWEIRLDAYLGDDLRPGDLLNGKAIPAPWGDPDQLLQPID